MSAGDFAEEITELQARRRSRQSGLLSDRADAPHEAGGVSRKIGDGRFDLVR